MRKLIFMLIPLLFNSCVEAKEEVKGLTENKLRAVNLQVW